MTLSLQLLPGDRQRVDSNFGPYQNKVFFYFTYAVSTTMTNDLCMVGVHSILQVISPVCFLTRGTLIPATLMVDSFNRTHASNFAHCCISSRHSIVCISVDTADMLITTRTSTLWLLSYPTHWAIAYLLPPVPRVTPLSARFPLREGL